MNKTSNQGQVVSKGIKFQISGENLSDKVVIL